MEQLNGWQRTWLVLTVVWVAFMALVAWSSWPNYIVVPLTPEQVQQVDYASLAKELRGELVPVTEAVMAPDPVGSLLSKAPLTPSQRRAASDAYTSSANEDELQEKMVALKLPRPVMADLWDLKYAQRPQNAPPPPPPTPPTAQPRTGEDWFSGITYSIAHSRQHQEVILLFVFGSAIPSLALYSMGLAVAWIVRGFRRD